MYFRQFKLLNLFTILENKVIIINAKIHNKQLHNGLLAQTIDIQPFDEIHKVQEAHNA